MTTDVPTLKLSPRAVIGKRVKKLRRGGVVPVHFYGWGTKALALQVDSSVLRRLLTLAGRNVPVNVEVEGQDGENLCFIREVQRHPVTEELLHVDFLKVDVNEVVTAEVPITLGGESLAVVNLGGTLLQLLQSLEVEALPMNMPSGFYLDVSVLDDFSKALRVSDIQGLDALSVSRDPHDMVAQVVPPRVEEEDEVAGEEDILEGEEGSEDVEADKSDAAD